MKPTLLFLAATAVMAAPSIAQELPSAGPQLGECFARVEIPAEYQIWNEEVLTQGQHSTIERRTQTRPEKREWRQVLCEVNFTPITVRAIQQALLLEGFYDGPLDGKLGEQTYAAVKNFQIARNLPKGDMTVTAVDALGVKWRTMNSGNQVGSSGGFTTGSTSATDSVAAGGGYTIDADGSVRSSAGAVIGKVNGNGEIMANGVVIGRVR